MRFTKYRMGYAPALSELKTSILRAKVYYLARVFGWKGVERKDMDYLVDEDISVSFYDIGQESYKASCPITGTYYPGSRAVIRYRHVPVTVSWTWWLAFRLKPLVGVHVHPDIPVHIHMDPGAPVRSILVGWLEEPEYIRHDS